MGYVNKYLRLSFSASLLAPLIFIGVYITFLLALRGSVPTSGELVEHLTRLYERFGYEIIILGAFLESLVIVNLFIPGASAVALGAVFARSGQIDLNLAVLAASFGSILGYLVNYTLGKFGFGMIFRVFGYASILNKVKNQIENGAVKTFGLSFIHPNIGSVVALAAGAIKMKFKNFFILSSLSTLVWFSFWGIMVFALGDVFLIILTKYMWVVVLLILSIWLLVSLYGNSRKVV